MNDIKEEINEIELNRLLKSPSCSAEQGSLTTPQLLILGDTTREGSGSFTLPYLDKRGSVLKCPGKRRSVNVCGNPADLVKRAGIGNARTITVTAA